MAVLLGFILYAGCANGTPTDADLRRTWEGAWVYLPASNGAGYRQTITDDLPTALRSLREKPHGIILYAHGCDGLSEISASTGRFVAQAGYVLVAPDDFARQGKPVSCDPATHAGGLDRAVLGWRQDELRFAFTRLRAVASLRNLPIVLMGHSEGAIAVATVTGFPVSARVVEGWTCHSGWPEYRGLHAAPGEPVLALAAENDPWFKLPVLIGDCGAFMQEGQSRSIVYRAPGYLADKHWLSSDPDVQHEILAFIGKAINRNRE
jgi:hypothetical protein